MGGLIDYVRLVNAKKSFCIKSAKFKEIEDLSKETESEDHVEIWTEFELKYAGELPESYRTLNAIIGDWVEENVDDLTKKLHPPLIKFLKKEYPESDLVDIEEGFEESPIWTDQADYMPRGKEGEKKISIEVDLVLEHEPHEGAWKPIEDYKPQEGK